MFISLCNCVNAPHFPFLTNNYTQDLENKYTTDDIIAAVLLPSVYPHPLSYVTLHLPVKEEYTSLIS